MSAEFLSKYYRRFAEVGSLKSEATAEETRLSQFSRPCRTSRNSTEIRELQSSIKFMDLYIMNQASSSKDVLVVSKTALLSKKRSRPCRYLVEFCRVWLSVHKNRRSLSFHENSPFFVNQKFRQEIAGSSFSLTKFESVPP